MLETLNEKSKNFMDSFIGYIPLVVSSLFIACIVGMIAVLGLAVHSCINKDRLTKEELCKKYVAPKEKKVKCLEEVGSFEDNSNSNDDVMDITNPAHPANPANPASPLNSSF